MLDITLQAKSLSIFLEKSRRGRTGDMAMDNPVFLLESERDSARRVFCYELQLLKGTNCHADNPGLSGVLLLYRKK